MGKHSSSVSTSTWSIECCADSFWEIRYCICWRCCKMWKHSFGFGIVGRSSLLFVDREGVCYRRRPDIKVDYLTNPTHHNPLPLFFPCFPVSKMLRFVCDNMYADVSWCREALNAPGCDAIHITEIENSIECDTFIPAIDLSEFQPWYSSQPFVENNIRFSFVTYVRVRNLANGDLIVKKLWRILKHWVSTFNEMVCFIQNTKSWKIKGVFLFSEKNF